MTYKPERYHRRSIRLPGYDYAAAGLYYVTICTQDRASLFGEMMNGEVATNALGEIVRQCWVGLPRHYGHVGIDAFVVMPNHVHGIITLIATNVGAGFKPAPTVPFTASARVPAQEHGPRHSLSEVVRAFKTFSARYINQSRSTPGARVWQRNYYEHIIRGERELNRIRVYIANNPSQWDRDEENPAYRPTQRARP